MTRPAAPRKALAGIPAALLLLAACSPVFFSEEPDATGEWRRVYVNDAAANDSLPPHVVRGGVKFVLQPGKPYSLTVAGAGSDDMLELFSVAGSTANSLRKIPGVAVAGGMSYSLNTASSSAGMHMGRLLTGGTPARVGKVSLASLDAGAADTLKVKLVFVQALSGYPTADHKANFATRFFTEMNGVLRPYGLAVSGVHEVVDPQKEAMNFPFTNLYVPLGGTRAPDHAHIYLVEKITVSDPETGLEGIVLGFAPREVVDLSQHRESRVVLSNQTPNIRRLAVTATHELAHFFGLRHTVSTLHDKLQDMDLSNTEDGFADTRYCPIDTTSALPKRAAADAAPEAGPGIVPGIGPRGEAGPYCLRMLADPCSPALGCDLTNLMHPNECDGTQVRLTAEQSAFLKRNIALYRR